MTADFYYLNLSPPCRTVAIVAKSLDVKYNIKTVDLLNKANFSEEYLKLNPQHTVPVFVDDGIVMSESQSIARYLIRKYGKTDNPFYPQNDMEKMYSIDRYLDFNVGTLFARILTLFKPVLLGTNKTFDNAAAQSLGEALGFLEKFLEGKIFLVGDTPTLAEISIAPVLTQIQGAKFDISRYPNILAWLNNCSTSIPHFKEENDAHLKQVENLFDMRLKDSGMTGPMVL